MDKHCQTNVPGVFAVGDVNGGLQFTYISLDDFRVVFSYLAGDGSYTLEDRLNVPNTMFITPALSQVGLTESQAAELKLPYAVKEIPVAAMPRGHVNGCLLYTSDNQSSYSFGKLARYGAFDDKSILAHEYPCLRIRLLLRLGYQVLLIVIRAWIYLLLILQ